ncbi:deoxyguanosinetriphosphate triphosphohydrolase [Candidatus Peregrinibacteria bacterium CG10_big_fil_rev_8_21_14_0_10_36_19]|nr:MAG: deoxyguanosinetriphosphate triphosphohydrolase [Candidatus Peregrinibacteria bacterium CG10_big_fil_rev_8_21_14_0_10_36_19]
MVSKEQLEQNERNSLATYAVKSADSTGRKYEEKSGSTRLNFQKDKDRVIHCKAFRRLDEKTQVFIAGSGDHYRTRLTHTIEVSQIARDLARRLGLNEDLCEVIALAHDLGHPPFGHGGEDALDQMMRKYGGTFEHNEQSRRIVEVLEKRYPNFDGLNLTHEVLDGLIKHQTAFDQAGKKFEKAAHLEAQVVNIADEIAYTNHDMDDGLRSGLISVDGLKVFKIWQLAEEVVRKEYDLILDADVFIARVISTIISLMIEDLCLQTTKNLEEFKIESVEDVKNFEGVLASFSNEMKEMVAELRNFLFNNFYMNPEINSLVTKGQVMIKKLFEFYMAHPNAFPMEKFLRDEEGIEVAVKDYIAGMTDGFLTSEFEKHIV